MASESEGFLFSVFGVAVFCQLLQEQNADSQIGSKTIGLSTQFVYAGFSPCVDKICVPRSVLTEIPVDDV